MALPPGSPQSNPLWWVVTYTQASNTGASGGGRFPVTAPGSPDQTGFLILQAPTASLATQEATQRLGFNGYGIEAHGPYQSYAAAQASVSSQKSQIAKGEQAGHIPNPLDLFHGLNLPGILLRIGEVLLGIVLIGVGLAKITGADNVINKAAKTAGVAALL